MHMISIFDYLRQNKEKNVHFEQTLRKFLFGHILRYSRAYFIFLLFIFIEYFPKNTCCQAKETSKSSTQCRGIKHNEKCQSPLCMSIEDRYMFRMLNGYILDSP
jgi:hypothetical protein